VGYLGVTVIVAVLVVAVTFGSFEQLAKIHVKAVWLLLGGLGIQIVITFAGIPRHLYDSLGFGLIMASYVLILAFCFVNIGIRGMGVITIGIALNALVIGLNQGMPTRDQPITTASGRHIRKPIEPDVKHRPESSSDLLPFLGDIIWLPQPLDAETVSFGDLILAVGICELAYYASRRRYTRGKGPTDTAVTADVTPDADAPADVAEPAGAPGTAERRETTEATETAAPSGTAEATGTAEPSETAEASETTETADAPYAPKLEVAQRTGTRAPRRSRTRSSAPSTRPS
jgi:hypothetical protein